MLIVACNTCHRQYDPDELVPVKYHPDRRCCPKCGTEKSLVAFDDDEIKDACYC